MPGNKEKESEGESVCEKEMEVVAQKKIAMLLPRGEEKSEQDGLIAFHR